MELYVIQEENEGIPDSPEIYLDESLADKRYIELINGAYRENAKTLDKAIEIFDAQEEYDDWLVRYWKITPEDEEESVEVLNEQEPFETDAEYKERMKTEPEYLKVKEE